MINKIFTKVAQENIASDIDPIMPSDLNLNGNNESEYYIFSNTTKLISALASRFNVDKRLVSIISLEGDLIILRSGFNADFIENIKALRGDGYDVTFNKRNKNDKHWRIKIKEGLDIDLDERIEGLRELFECISDEYDISLIYNHIKQQFLVHKIDTSKNNYGGIFLLDEHININFDLIWNNIEKAFDGKREIKYLYMMTNKDSDLAFLNVNKMEDRPYNTLHPSCVFKVAFKKSKPIFVFYSLVDDKVNQIGWLGSREAGMIISYYLDKLRRMNILSFVDDGFKADNEYIVMSVDKIREYKKMAYEALESVGSSENISILFEDVDMIGGDSKDVNADSLAYVFAGGAYARLCTKYFLDSDSIPLCIGQNMFLSRYSDQEFKNTVIHELAHIAIDKFFDGKSWTDDALETQRKEYFLKIDMVHGDVFQALYQILLSHKKDYNDLISMDESEVMSFCKGLSEKE